LPNPFGNETADECIVKIQLQTGGLWVAVGQGGHENSQGVIAEAMEEGIVVQTADNGIGLDAANGPLNTGVVALDGVLAPCRVVVFRIGGTI